MARPHPSDHASSDDDAPEVVSQFLSRRDAKRVEKNFRDFEAEENVRKKVQNQERDRKLKERAVITRMGKPSGNVWRKEKRKTQRENDAESDHSACSAKDDETPEDPLEMRMRRAMQDAATETGDEDDTKSDGDSEDMSDEEMDEGSDEGGIDEEMTELDAERRLEEDGEGDDVEGEASDEDEDQRRIFPKSSAKGQYLEDGLFAAAFTSSSQNAMAVPTATKSSQKAQLSRKRQRRRLAHPKDLLVGTRTIRTLLNPLGSNIRSTAHTIPPQKIRRFIDRSLAVKGKLASANAKARGWERRPANVGVMKCIGAPSGFVRGKQ